MMRVTNRRYEGGLLVEESIAEYDFDPPPDPPSVKHFAEEALPEGVVLRGPWDDAAKAV